MPVIRARTAAACLLFCGCAPRAAPLSPPGRQEDVVFSRSSPLSRTAEIARRTLTPLTLRRGEEVLVASGKDFREQPLDPAREQFRSTFLPGRRRPAGTDCWSSWRRGTS